MACFACPIGQAADQIVIVCSDATAGGVAFRCAPHGARRVGLRLEVGWAGGKRVFDSDPSCDDSIGGPCWNYCEYNPELKVSLLYKSEGDLFTGVLLNDTTGAMQPGGTMVMFSPDRRYYLAWEHSDGQWGDTLKLYSRGGALVWQGDDSIQSPDGTVIGRFDGLRWTDQNQLRASENYDDSRRAVTVTLTKRGNGRWEWQPEAAR